tara:strand:- start:8230 stop:8556 length:327 start_codon:yes stop_codon:yes gene_type:complete
MEYGKNEKRISFMDNDKRAAELIVRLKHDGLTKTKFFRAILTGYLERDEFIISFIDGLKEEKGNQSKNKSRKVKNLENEGKENKSKFGLDDGDIKNIFDILEKEHPDL